MKKVILLISLCLVFNLSFCLSAQDLTDIYSFFAKGSPDKDSGNTTFRSLLLPSGGLYEGMGTAYTAMARDSSYFDANPAASTFLKKTEIAVNHNNWIADSKLETAVYSMRLGDFGLSAGGKWFYVPFNAIDDSGNDAGFGYYSEFNFGISASYNFFKNTEVEGIALGLTARLAYRSVPDVSKIDLKKDSALAYMFDIGFMTRLNFLKFDETREKNFAIGLMLKNLGPAVQKDPIPSYASLGIAYSPFEWLFFTADLSLYASIDPWIYEGLSFAFGSLFQITSFFDMHAGFNLKGANPRFTIGTGFDLSIVKLNVNYTLDLASQLTPLNRISISGALALADIKRDNLEKRLESLYLEGLNAFANGQAEKAKSIWTQVLELDKSYFPARDSLNQMKNRDELKKRLEAIQSI